MFETQTINVDEVISETLPTRAFAAQSSTSQLALWNFERRAVGPRDVLIKIRYCGVCHTDIHFLKNDLGFSVYPLVPGHEIVGIVTRTGDLVKKFSEGDVVGVGCLVESCRTCANCKEGEEQYCLNGAVYTYNGIEKETGNITYGGYSSQVVVNEDFVLHVSDKLPLEKVAPLLCAGITTYSPLRRWNIGKNHRVAIVGLGGLGHMAVKFARSFGADVTLLSTSPLKEQDALALGANQFAVTTDDVQVQKLTGSFDFILDTICSQHDLNIYLGMLKTHGSLVYLGIDPAPSKIALVSMVFSGRTVAGSLIGGIAETQEMLNYCAEHNITSDVEIIDIKDINEAYVRMVNKDVKYRFVIDMATL
ncbi:NAD(P)-dependent alcohol dehydrogenase [Segetibacter sp.]|uniref:NAD(P)-dependent alcohol dehydrogenase n=1 Tax=Segetibacter sp. TaxID=2231182 RepID=UPI00262B3EC4|nr:NAD(P)-dependent alcohol dehydrogenase [Segetibacter sp.]MCW3082145.1 putative zinc-type alcohol dehydrogenase-like protein [Segetibacter sp.]